LCGRPTTLVRPLLSSRGEQRRRRSPAAEISPEWRHGARAAAARGTSSSGAGHERQTSRTSSSTSRSYPCSPTTAAAPFLTPRDARRRSPRTTMEAGASPVGPIFSSGSVEVEEQRGVDGTASAPGPRRILASSSVRCGRGCWCSPQRSRAWPAAGLVPVAEEHGGGGAGGGSRW
jgi:hypothetical protein